MIINKTNRQFFGIMERMMEILPMWRMIRLLKENGSVWGDLITKGKITRQKEEDGTKEKIKLAFGKKWEEVYEREIMVDLNMKTLEYGGGMLCAKRGTLIEAYIRKYYTKLSGGENFATEQKIRKSREVGNLIDQCIDDKGAFMGIDPMNVNIVYLTRNGVAFSDWIGLVNEYIYSFGILRLVIVWVISLLLAIFKDTIIEWAKYIFSL